MLNDLFFWNTGSCNTLHMTVTKFSICICSSVDSETGDFSLLEEMGEEFFLSDIGRKFVYCHHVSIKIVRYFYDLYDRVGELHQGYMVGQENIFRSD